MTPAHCLFCRIVARDLPAEIVYEDEHVLAFLDARPLARGHTLVIPKTHIERLRDLPERLTGPLFAAVVKVSHTQREKLGAPGFTVGINDGPVAGQAIPHLHLHVVPRWERDGGTSLHGLFKGSGRA